MVEPFNGISFSNKNEKNTDTYYKINEPWKHAKWKKPVTKVHKITQKCNSIHMKCSE